MKTEVEHITNSIKATFEGAPWYGESLLVKLKTINSELVNESINTSNTIGNLVAHLIQWRLFVIEKLKGNTQFDIEINSKSDWPETTIKSKADWNHLITKLKSSQDQIIDLLSKKEDSFLNKQTSGTNYNNRTLLTGIIQHDIYHLGQISLIKKQIEQKNLTDK